MGLVSDPRAVYVGRGVFAARNRGGSPFCVDIVEMGFLDRDGRA